MNNSELIKTENIRTDGGTQSRAKIDHETLQDYINHWKSGGSFPPITCFYDGKDYWLADGFHRLSSYKEANKSHGEIAAIIHQGTQRDAILYSVGANNTNGLRRSNADKRRAVIVLLSDAEWSKWNNVEIAKKAGVDEGLVRIIKSELCTEDSKPDLAKKCGIDESAINLARKQVQANSKPRNTDKSSSKSQQLSILPKTDQEIIAESPIKIGDAVQFIGEKHTGIVLDIIVHHIGGVKNPETQIKIRVKADDGSTTTFQSIEFFRLLDIPKIKIGDYVAMKPGLSLALTQIQKGEHTFQTFGKIISSYTDPNNQDTFTVQWRDNSSTLHSPFQLVKIPDEFVEKIKDWGTGDSVSAKPTIENAVILTLENAIEQVLGTYQTLDADNLHPADSLQGNIYANHLAFKNKGRFGSIINQIQKAHAKKQVEQAIIVLHYSLSGSKGFLSLLKSASGIYYYLNEDIDIIVYIGNHFWEFREVFKSFGDGIISWFPPSEYQNR